MSETNALLDERSNPYDDPRAFQAFLLDDLVIDSIGQRAVDPERVRRIAHDFDWLRFETPTVVLLSDGRARVIEGMHRITALRSIADETTVVMCAVLPIPPDRPIEAAIAFAIVRGRRGHSALERWKLLVTMGEPHELAAMDVLAHRHLRLGVSPDPVTIAAVNSVSRIMHGARRTPEVGAQLLGRVLDIIAAAFVLDE